MAKLYPAPGYPRRKKKNKMAAISITGPSRDMGVPIEDLEAKWYAAYTRPHHEKRIAEQLERKLVEAFLPLYGVTHRWKDRWMRLQLPLFPGYVFVRVALRDRLRILEIPGVIRLVGFGRHPAALPGEQIEALRNGLGHPRSAAPHAYLTAGCRVRINRGPLQGLEGVMLRQKGQLRVIISVELIMSSVAVDVNAADIDLLGIPT